MRITHPHLQSLADRINKATNSPLLPYSVIGKRHRIGNYHIDDRCLVRTVNKDGGVLDVFECGQVTKTVLHGLMKAYLAGLEFGK